MAGKYNFSRKIGDDTFAVDGCDSFDEAIKKVEKGIYDYELTKRVNVPEQPLVNKESTYVGPQSGTDISPNSIPNSDNAGNDDAGKEAKASESVNE